MSMIDNTQDGGGNNTKDLGRGGRKLTHFRAKEPISASKFNMMVDAINARQTPASTLKQVVRRQIGRRQYVEVKNNAGANIERGEVLYINSATHANGKYTLGGIYPTEKYHQKLIGFALDDVASGNIGMFQLWGEILGKVTGTSSYAYINPSSGTLKTNAQPSNIQVISTTGTLAELVVLPPPAYDSVVKYQSHTTIGGYDVINATNAWGETVYVMPSPSVNVEDWDGKTINGITYTRVSATQRTASDGVNPSWTEDLFPPYQSNEQLAVVPWELDDTTDFLIAYKECGSNKVWVKDCS